MSGVWDDISTSESVVKIGKDQFLEGNVCHAKKFVFYSGGIGDLLKETIWWVN